MRTPAPNQEDKHCDELLTAIRHALGLIEARWMEHGITARDYQVLVAIWQRLLGLVVEAHKGGPGNGQGPPGATGGVEHED